MNGFFRINVEAIPGFEEKLRRYGDRAAAILGEVVRDGAHRVVRRAKTRIASGPKTGRIYRRGRVRHQASREGEYPAADTGNLMRSIHDEHGETGVDTFTALVVADTEYAAPLELKPEEKGGRPFLSRALHEEADAILDAAEAKLREAFGP